MGTLLALPGEDIYVWLEVTAAVDGQNTITHAGELDEDTRDLLDGGEPFFLYLMAQGPVGAVCMGWENHAAYDAALALGRECKAHAKYTLATGWQAEASWHGEVAYAVGKLEGNGGGKTSTLLLSRTTTNATPTAMVGAVTKTVHHEDNAAQDCVVQADAANGALEIQVTGLAAETVRWYARVDLIAIRRQWF